MSVRNQPCGVYVIGEEIGTEADGYTPIMSPYVKIGIANKPEHRISNLNSGNPRNLLMLHWKGFATRLEARNVEKRVHRELAEARRVGEWFEVSPTVASLCVEFVS